MAKHPDWSTIDPSYQVQHYWTSAATCGNPNAGSWTDNKTIVGANFISDRGVRSYAVTAGFNSPSRNTLVKPLAYSATYEKQSDDYEQHQVEYRTLNCTVNGVNVPTRYVYQDSTTITHNIFSLSFQSGEYDASSVLNRATNKLLDNLKDQKVNLAQAFAEREETVKTVASAMQTTAKVLLNLKRGNFAGAAKALGISPPKRGQRRFNKAFANDVTNAMTDGWLALQYGWRPLLQDVHGAAETLAQASLGSENRNSVSASTFGQSKKMLTLRKSTTTKTSGWSGYNVTRYECDGFYLVRIGVRYSRSSAPVSSLAKIGILNPAQLAWELVPYSFVVDWFLPIGNWLSGLDATAGLAFESGYRTTLLKQKQLASQNIDITRDDGLATRSLLEIAKRDYVQMTRTPLTGFPSAPAPSFKNPISMSHLASAFSLLKQFKR